MFKKDTNLTILSSDTAGVIVRADGKTFAMNKKAASLIGIEKIS